MSQNRGNKPINDSFKHILRSGQNLIKFFRDRAKKTVLHENSVKCGLGRKIIYLAKTKGVPQKINYPFNYKGIVIKDKQDLEELINLVITSKYGEGYLAYVINANEIVVLGATYRKKKNNCTLDIADYITLNDISKSASECLNLKSVSFHTTDGQSDYTISELDGANIAVVYYGENKILAENEYSLSGDTLTITPTPTQELRVVVLYTK